MKVYEAIWRYIKLFGGIWRYIGIYEPTSSALFFSTLVDTPFSTLFFFNLLVVHFVDIVFFQLIWRSTGPGRHPIFFQTKFHVECRHNHVWRPILGPSYDNLWVLCWPSFSQYSIFWCMWGYMKVYKAIWRYIKVHEGIWRYISIYKPSFSTLFFFNIGNGRSDIKPKNCHKWGPMGSPWVRIWHVP